MIRDKTEQEVREEQIHKIYAGMLGKEQTVLRLHGLEMRFRGEPGMPICGCCLEKIIDHCLDRSPQKGDTMICHEVCKSFGGKMIFDGKNWHKSEHPSDQKPVRPDAGSMKLVVDNKVGGSSEPPLREFTEGELRAALMLAMLAIERAGAVAGTWHRKRKKPSTDDYVDLVGDLLGAEALITDLLKHPPSDGHSLDPHIEEAAKELARIRAAA